MNLGDVVNEKREVGWTRLTWRYLIVTLPLVIGIVLSVSAAIDHWIVAPREQTSHGTVFAHDAANHNQYGYTFSVDGKSYTGWQSPKSDDLKVGAHVLVYYDPRNPAENSLTEFGDWGMEEFGPVIPMLAGAGIIVFCIFQFQRDKRINAKPAV